MSQETTIALCNAAKVGERKDGCGIRGGRERLKEKRGLKK